MGADISFYVEKYDDKNKSWEYAGAYDKEGDITSLLYVRAHNYEEYLDACEGVDPLGSGRDVSEEIFEKFRDHFDPGREEYDGIYKSGTVTLAELERQYLRVPQVVDYDADDGAWVPDEKGNLVEKPMMNNPLIALHKYAKAVSEMMGHWTFDDRKVRLVFFCDN